MKIRNVEFNGFYSSDVECFLTSASALAFFRARNLSLADFVVSSVAFLAAATFLLSTGLTSSTSTSIPACIFIFLGGGCGEDGFSAVSSLSVSVVVSVVVLGSGVLSRLLWLSLLSL